MQIRYGLVLAMAIGLGFTGCAAGGGGGSTPAPVRTGGGGAGVNPSNTDLTRAAEAALASADEAATDAEALAFYEQALEHARGAIVENGTNPLAHRLAAMASMGVGDYVAADQYFNDAAELRPLYEFDFDGIRERAWIDLYQTASPLVQAADYEEAIVVFEKADAIYQGRPEAMITLAQLYAQLREHDQALASLDDADAFLASDAMTQVDSVTAEGWRDMAIDLPTLRAQVYTDAGRFEEASGIYRGLVAENPGDAELKRGLAGLLMQMGDQAAAFTLYEEMMSMSGLTSENFFNIGVGFYQGSDYGRAAQAFGGAAGVSVNDRDSIEMWARSLQLDSAFADVPAVAKRWSELDPNSQNALLILAQSTNVLGDQSATQVAIQAVDALDVNMSDLQLRRFAEGGATVSGSLINKKLSDGASVSVRFTFYDNGGAAIGTVTESVSLGAADMATVFQVQFDSAERVGGYGYELTAG